MMSMCKQARARAGGAVCRARASRTRTRAASTSSGPVLAGSASADLTLRVGAMVSIAQTAYPLVSASGDSNTDVEQRMVHVREEHFGRMSVEVVEQHRYCGEPGPVWPISYVEFSAMSC